jgi:hypothetical protein
METGSVGERDWADTWQARRIDSGRTIIERGIHSSRPHAITMGADAGGARRNFAWHGDESLHPADRRHTRASTKSAETKTYSNKAMQKVTFHVMEHQ